MKGLYVTARSAGTRRFKPCRLTSGERFRRHVVVRCEGREQMVVAILDTRKRCAVFGIGAARAEQHADFARTEAAADLCMPGVADRKARGRRAVGYVHFVHG